MADSVVEGLPPGFRFFPTEEELVSFYLHQNKLEGKRPDLNPVIDRIIPTLDITQFNPWDLPNYAGEVCREDSEWFFFIPMQEREARGGRPNRLTTSGYWKATGCPGYVYSSQTRIIGVKRTMVFYQGRAPAGQKTDWKMNEYKAIEADSAAASSSSSNVHPKLRHEFSLCRLYKKSKNMRAFDRRPSWAGNEGGSGAEAAAMVTQVQVPAGESTSYGPQHDQDLPLQLAPENMTSSPEGSSSGHGGSQVGVHPSTTGQSVSTIDMDVDNWDWSTLEWF